jgi:hypothetical protein
MKKLSLIAAAVVLASSGAFAGTATDQFDVSIDFTGGCSVQTAVADFTFTYVAFGAAQSTTQSTVFKCSRGLTPTFSFDNPGAAQTGATNVALATAVTGEGVIAGVRYTLSGATSRSTTGTAAAAGANGTAGTNGSADEYTVAITAAIPGNQAGTGAGGAGALTQTRTLTISY